MAMQEKAGRWVAMRVARKVGKSVPIIGTALSVGLLAHAVRRKGTVAGIIDSALDAIPIFGTLKNGIELLTEDWFPDRPMAPALAAGTGSATARAPEVRGSAAPRSSGPPTRGTRSSR